MIKKFKNRLDAARQLLPLLDKYKHHSHAIIFGLPRGGMVLADEISNGLHLPLDMFVPRKISHPSHSEYAIGAVTEDGSVMLDDEAMTFMGLTRGDVEPLIQKQIKESQRRQKVYRIGKPILDLHQKTVIIVDDGIATGNTMKAAIVSAKNRGCDRIVVVVPVAPSDKVEEFKALVDEFVCLFAPSVFHAVGQFYDAFDQVEDEEVIQIMKNAHQRGSSLK